MDGIEVLMWFLISGLLWVSLIYLVMWMIIEMPVLIKIKHEELYERWRNR
tara:strand:+ start:216 stop:365 length:150 start_codon:yes stop_codon:yes gene_type:complete